MKKLSILSLVIGLVVVPGLLRAGELHEAARTGDIAKGVELVGIKKVDVNSREEGTNRTALLVAVKAGKNEFAGFLLQQPNIDVNAQDRGGNTALHQAYVSGDKKLIQILEQRGAKKDIRNNDGKTAEELGQEAQKKLAFMVQAAKKEPARKKLVEAIKKATSRKPPVTKKPAEAPAKKKPEDIEDALFKAIRDGDIEKTRTISMEIEAARSRFALRSDAPLKVAAGALPRLRPEVRVPMFKLLEKEFLVSPGVFNKLIGFTQNYSDEDKKSIAEVVKYLIEETSSYVNGSLGESNLRLIHLAAQSLNPWLVKVLIQLGADVNAESRFGMPLHSVAGAAEMPHAEEVVSLLINAGANTNVLNHNKKSPFDIALEISKSGRVSGKWFVSKSILELLKVRGAKKFGLGFKKIFGKKRKK